MALVEVLPTVQGLTRAEKLQLIQLLAQDLATVEEEAPFLPGKAYSVWSPYQAFEAANKLLQELEKDCLFTGSRG